MSLQFTVIGPGYVRNYHGIQRLNKVLQVRGEEVWIAIVWLDGDPEVWILESPEKVVELHKLYYDDERFMGKTCLLPTQIFKKMF